jgi:hypothetical protein
VNENKRRRRPGYWRAYLRARKRELKKIVRKTRRLLKDKPPPWRNPARGRPYKYPAKDMVILCVLKAYLDASYLRAEDLAPTLLGISPDDNTVWRAMRRLGEEYVSSLAGRAAEMVQRHRRTPSNVFVADSSGLSEPEGRGVQGPEVKLHTLALLPWNVVVSAKVTPGSRHDSPVLREMLGDIIGPALLLADSAYFSRENILLCFSRRIVPVIKPREGIVDPFLRRYAVFYDAALNAYRFRSVAEGVYGAMEGRYRCRLRGKTFDSQVTEGLLHVLVHNLLALLKAEEALSLVIAALRFFRYSWKKELWDNPKLG